MPDVGRYDGFSAAEIAVRLGIVRVELFGSTTSTMDVAHALGDEGAPAGTLVLADRQTAGRGRGGRAWSSEAGRGIWLTLLERPNDPSALDVLSLRLGLRAARVLDRFADTLVRLKWPNDLYLGERKLGGILVEARWREGLPEWVAVGLGLNVALPPDVPTAAALADGVRRIEVLEELLPVLRAAASGRGHLSAAELREFGSRDLAAGRECVTPARGTVRGITADGALCIGTDAGLSVHRGGSLLLEGTPE